MARPGITGQLPDDGVTVDPRGAVVGLAPRDVVDDPTPGGRLDSHPDAR